MSDSTTTIIPCFSCGAKNRLPSSWSGIPRCGTCGRVLPILGHTHAHSSPGATAQPRSRSRSRLSTVSRSWKRTAAVLIGVVAVGIAVYAISSKPQSLLGQAAFQPAVSSVAQAQTAAPAPVYVAPGILWDYTGRERVAPLEIVTSPGADYFIKLVNVPNGSDALAIYVRGGNRLEVLVPLGDFEMRYAAGPVWYGERDLFGEQTSYTRAIDIFSFTQDENGYGGYTVELILQVGGNLRTEQVGPEDF